MLILNTPLLIAKHNEVIANKYWLADFIGGSVGDFLTNYRDEDGEKAETCTVKLSYALNYSGSEITELDSLKKRKRYKSGRDGKKYLVSVPDMVEYLTGRYGKATNIKGDAAHKKNVVQGQLGILAFGHRHIDIWRKTQTNSDVIDLFDCASSKKRGLFFWEIPNWKVSLPPIGTWRVKVNKWTWIYTVEADGRVAWRDAYDSSSSGTGRWGLGAFGTISFQWNSQTVEIWNLPPLPSGEITGVCKMEGEPRYSLIAQNLD